MIDYNQNFAQALRNVLIAAGLTDAQITTTLQGELREADIAATYPAVVAALGNGAALRAALIGAVQGLGGVFTVATNMWDVGPTNIAPALRHPATEELNAICQHGGTAGFDGAKAITNLLRLAKAAQRM